MYARRGFDWNRRRWLWCCRQQEPGTGTGSLGVESNPALSPTSGVGVGEHDGDTDGDDMMNSSGMYAGQGGLGIGNAALGVAGVPISKPRLNSRGNWTAEEVRGWRARPTPPAVVAVVTPSLNRRRLQSLGGV